MSTLFPLAEYATLLFHRIFKISEIFQAKDFKQTFDKSPLRVLRLTWKNTVEVTQSDHQ